ELARRYLREDQTALIIYHPEKTGVVAPSAGALRARLERAQVAPLEGSQPVEQPAVVRNGGAPPRERVEAGIHIYRLSSGVPVLIKRRPNSPIVYAGVFALGGASAEREDIGGRTLLMARTAVKGTSRRTAVQIAEDGELLGGSVGAVVGGDSVGWTISVPKQHAAAALDLLADVAQRPTFETQALETERAIAFA